MYPDLFLSTDGLVKKVFSIELGRERAATVESSTSADLSAATEESAIAESSAIARSPSSITTFFLSSFSDL